MAIPDLLDVPQQGDPGHNSHHRYLHEFSDLWVLDDRSRFYLPSDFVLASALGAPDGVATLDGSGQIEPAQLSSSVVTKDGTKVGLRSGSETFDRIQLDYQNGRVLLSDGAHTPTPLGGPVAGLFPDRAGDVPTFDVTAPYFGMDPTAREIGAIINEITGYALTLGPVRIYIPIGTYTIEEQIYLNSGTEIFGAGREYTHLVLDDTARPGTNWFGVLQIGPPGENVKAVTIRDLHIDGNRRAIDPTDFCSGIYYTGNGEKREIYLTRLRVSDCTQYGIGLQGAGFQYGIFLDDIEIERVGADGLDQKGSTRGNTRCFMRNISFRDFGLYDTDNAGLDLRGEWIGVNICCYAQRVPNAQGATTPIAIRFRSGQYDGGGNRQGARNCRLDNVKVYATGGNERYVIRAEPEQSPPDDSLGAYGNYVNGSLIPIGITGIVPPTGTTQKGFPTPLAQATSITAATTTLTTPTFTIDPYDVIEIVLVTIKPTGVGDAPSVISHTFDAGLSISAIDTVTQNAIRLSRYRAMADADMTDLTGTISFTFPTALNDFKYLIVTAWSGISCALPGGADAFVQSAVAQNSSGLQNAPVLAAAQHADNIGEHIVLINASSGGTLTVTKETGWTRIHEVKLGGERTLVWFWTPTFDATPTLQWSPTSSQHVGIASELRCTRANAETP